MLTDPTTIVIISVGSSATLFLLSCSWWLWRHAPQRPAGPNTSPAIAEPPSSAEAPSPAQAPPSPSPSPAHETPATMEWGKPAPAAPDRATFEAPVEPAKPDLDDGARTMFFIKKRPTSDKTEIIPEALDSGSPEHEDAPAAVDQLQTAPTRRASKAKANTTAPPPPPPFRQR